MTSEVIESPRNVTKKQTVQILHKISHHYAKHSDADHCADCPNPEKVEQWLQNRTAIASCGVTHCGHYRDHEADSKSLQRRLDQSEHEHDRYPKFRLARINRPSHADGLGFDQLVKHWLQTTSIVEIAVITSSVTIGGYRTVGAAASSKRRQES